MRPLIAGNWKMNGDSSWVSKPKSFEALLSKSERQDIDVLICPPALYIQSLRTAASGLGIFIGGQTCHEAVSGAHTGDVSADMLKDVGATYVIVGHSERRAIGETDSDVKAQAEAALAAGLIPIICVGESFEQREVGAQNGVVSAQLNGSTPETEARDSQEIVVAYEPIWAIGTGKTATPEDVRAMHAHIRAEIGEGVRILYGGSVKPANAAEILKTPHVNGALIGGASLAMDSFAAIAKAAL